MPKRARAFLNEQAAAGYRPVPIVHIDDVYQSPAVGAKHAQLHARLDGAAATRGGSVATAVSGSRGQKGGVKLSPVRDMLMKNVYIDGGL